MTGRAYEGTRSGGAAQPPAEGSPLLRVEGLETRFDTDAGPVHAVRGVSFSVSARESLAIVGESGSGKTVTALSLMDLVPPSSGTVSWTELSLGDESLSGLTPRQWQDVRGRRIAMVFQDPMTSLNPVLTVGKQVEEVLLRHLELDKPSARRRALELLDLVGIPTPDRRAKDHPHQFSGGQRQRIMIAMALAADPQVLIADEPTTALDVTIQAQIVDLVRGLQERLDMAVIWITHDLALVAGLADRVLVMYAGRIVEEAPTAALFASPAHPYTALLLRSLPRLDDDRARLAPIEGTPPDLSVLEPGCSFAPRCPLAEDRCRKERPPLDRVGEGHRVSCWRTGDVAGLEGG